MPNIISNTWLSILKFWSQFGLDVYEQGDANTMDSPNRPAAANMPYITINVPFGDYFQNDLMTAQVWTRSSNNAQLFAALDKIEAAIPPQSGTKLMIYDYDPNTGIKNSNKPIGAYAIYRSTPFINLYPQDDPIIRVRIVTVIVRNYVKG